MDGFWVMEFGQGGAARYLLTFSFLILPIIYAWRRADRIPSLAAQRAICALVWICVIRTWNLLPNSAVDSWHVFVGGAVCGVVAYESQRRTEGPGGARRRARAAPSESERPPADDEPETEPSSGGSSIGAGLLTR